MAGFEVTPLYLLSTYLSGLVTRLPQLAEPSCAGFLADAIAEAQWKVARDLGTRFAVTKFVPQFDPNLDTAPTDPTYPAEFEPYYQWPGVLPGDGFPRIKPRIRPLQQVISLILTVPGTIISQFTFDQSWLRCDRKSNEIVIAPTGSNAIYALAYAMGGLAWRTPQTAALTYCAGLDPASQDWPKVNRLTAMRATIALLPMLSGWLNPTALASQSADGISQSRKSGYIFADWAEKLEKECELLTNEILAAWDGPGLVVL
jgi:hypothetical protein